VIAVTLHGDRLLRRLSAMFEALARRRALRPRARPLRLDPARAHILPPARARANASFETRPGLRPGRSSG